LGPTKARGIRLGRNGAEQLAPKYRAEANERARQLAPLLMGLRAAGLSAKRMAMELNSRQIDYPDSAIR